MWDKFIQGINTKDTKGKEFVKKYGPFKLLCEMAADERIPMIGAGVDLGDSKSFLTRTPIWTQTLWQLFPNAVSVHGDGFWLSV